MRRKDHPSFPNAITCCFLSSLKTLLMPREPTKPPLGVNVLDFPMAGFQPTLYGRFCVTPEGILRHSKCGRRRSTGCYEFACRLWSRSGHGAHVKSLGLLQSSVRGGDYSNEELKSKNLVSQSLHWYGHKRRIQNTTTSANSFPLDRLTE